MKILHCTDLSNKIPRIPPELFQQIDFILLGGDVTMGAKSQAVNIKVFTALETSFPKEIPIFIIPGNHDHPEISEEPPYFPPNFTQMHRRICLFEITRFSLPILMIGFGGASINPMFPLGPGPNYTSFSEEEIYQELESLFQDAREIQATKKVFTLLFLHEPPFNTRLDYTLMNKHAGSHSIQRIIEEYQPQLAVVGHIHESIGIDQLGNTLMVNPGEAKYNHYDIISIDNTTYQITIDLYPKSTNPSEML
jgi:Icc-related predicted phosphoesterase